MNINFWRFPVEWSESDCKMSDDVSLRFVHGAVMKSDDVNYSDKWRSMFCIHANMEINNDF